MIWMNEHDVSETQRLVDGRTTPNLAKGALVLSRLVRWTNDNSDGWPYWVKPQRAAGRLMEAIHARDYAIRFGHDRTGQPLTDLTDRELTLALAPIKRFLTAQGVEHRGFVS